MLDRHPHHEVGHLAWRYRPASTSVGAAVVLPGNQPPVPTENRVGCDDAGDLRQHPPAEFLASPRESTALGVGQAKWTCATLLPEDPILLPERIDHVFLVVVHPASGREYEEAQSVGHSLRLLGEQPLAPTLFRRFANLGRFVAPYAVAVYETAGARGATVVIPPAKTATVSGHGPRSPARDRTITLVKTLGRRQWKKASGYHRQGRVENAFFRYKSIIGDGLRARSPAGQGSEVVLGCEILNRMTALGRPVSYRIGR